MDFLSKKPGYCSESKQGDFKTSLEKKKKEKEKEKKMKVEPGP